MAGKARNTIETGLARFIPDQDSHLVKDGRSIESPHENIAELSRLASAFGERELTLLQTLRIA